MVVNIFISSTQSRNEQIYANLVQHRCSNVSLNARGWAGIVVKSGWIFCYFVLLNLELCCPCMLIRGKGHGKDCLTQVSAELTVILQFRLLCLMAETPGSGFNLHDFPKICE